MGEHGILDDREDVVMKLFVLLVEEDAIMWLRHLDDASVKVGMISRACFWYNGM